MTTIEEFTKRVLEDIEFRAKAWGEVQPGYVTIGMHPEDWPELTELAGCRVERISPPLGPPRGTAYLINDAPFIRQLRSIPQTPEDVQVEATLMTTGAPGVLPC